MTATAKINRSDPGLIKLNAVRVIIVMMIAFGYASTMPIGPGNPEIFNHLGYDPSWVGISLLFFFSGFLALRSLKKHGSAWKYLESRFFRNMPMLAAVTLFVGIVLYPVYGNPSGSISDTVKTVGLYVLGTVSCIRPGEPLPGLLDDSKYMCLIQGAIWTLKWGVIAHIMTAIGQKLGVFGNRYFVLSIAIGSVISYFALNFAYINLGVAIDQNIVLAARLAWPFLVGMAVYEFRDVFASVQRNLLTSVLLFAAAWFWYALLPWTGAIEILMTLGWFSGFMSLLATQSKTLPMLNNWSPLALAIYLIHWPIAQILLLNFPDLGQWGLIAATLPLALGLGWAAHIVISKRSYAYASSRQPAILTA